MAESDETPRESWDWVLQFYGWFRDHQWWAFLGPFRRLVARLAESEWAARFWASQQLTAMIISPVPGWPQRMEWPRLVLIPLDGIVRIERCISAGQVAAEEECPLESCWPRVESGLRWLAEASA
jgi:hypothetical protein